MCLEHNPNAKYVNDIFNSNIIQMELGMYPIEMKDVKTFITCSIGFEVLSLRAIFVLNTYHYKPSFKRTSPARFDSVVIYLMDFHFMLGFEIPNVVCTHF